MSEHAEIHPDVHTAPVLDDENDDFANVDHRFSSILGSSAGSSACSSLPTENAGDLNKPHNAQMSDSLISFQTTDMSFGDGDPPSGTHGEAKYPSFVPSNPTQSSTATVNGESSIEAITHKIQESLSLSKRHRFWETQPVGQFKDLGDASLPEGSIEPPTPLSEMEIRDVPAVTALLRVYLSKFAVAPDLDEKDVAHWLLPRENVVDSFLVKSPETHEITDFCSFYTLPSLILNNANYTNLKAAYSFYNVATKTPLLQLMNDALIVAKQKDYDVFNALDVMENESLLKELKFGPGDGMLHYYLYNYRLRHALKPSELGLVLL
ncbi:Glycylpeptide N-tetradecanoyltransferase 1 [Platanthera zijinensis]|uniref:Glycylpeptide N-tetradecanoyltransferase n=1 Tax=Platanthera zijinensis TaxID=2320716 RepID=A0AAP0ATP5_9ASPA